MYYFNKDSTTIYFYDLNCNAPSSNLRLCLRLLSVREISIFNLWKCLSDFLLWASLWKMSKENTFLNESNKAIIDKINRCNELFIKTGQGSEKCLDFDLPKMAVIGSQSSGKSSILEVIFLLENNKIEPSLGFLNF